jgi:hypothetical protein
MPVLRRAYENTVEEEEGKMTKHTMRKTKQKEMAIGKPTVRIGKKEPTDLLVNEISKQLDKRRNNQM